VILQNITYPDNEKFLNYIALIYSKQAYANALGAEISNASFKAIILNSLPYFCDLAITTLYRKNDIYRGNIPTRDLVTLDQS